MESFVKVLAAAFGVIFIAILLGASMENVNFYGKSGGNFTIFSAEIGKFGEVGEASRAINIGDISIGYTKNFVRIVEESNVKIQKGLFRDNSYTWVVDGDEIESIRIEGFVSDTNLYGELVVEVNGEVVWRNKTMPGRFELVIRDVDPRHNEISLKATSSGFKFWAPTTYLFSELEISKYDYTQSEWSGGIKLYPYEVEGFDRGVLAFYVDEAVKNSDLKIDINSKTVYSARPQQSPVPYEVEFDKTSTALVAGENSVHIYTGRDAAYMLRNVVLKIYYYGATQKSYKTYRFRLDPNFLEFMDKQNMFVVLKIKVDDVFVRGILEVNLNDKYHREFEIDGGHKIITAKLDDSYLSSKNTITIASTGSFDIERMDIVVGKE